MKPVGRMGVGRKNREGGVRAVEPTGKTVTQDVTVCWLSSYLFLLLISHSRPDVISCRLPSHHPLIDKQMSPMFD